MANRRLNGSAQLSVPWNEGTVGLQGGRAVLDLNSRDALPSFFHTISTLFFGYHRLKLYEQTFGGASWLYQLPGNVRLSAAAGWECRERLLNRTDFTVNERHKAWLTSNNPLVPGQDEPLFDVHRAFRMSVTFSYDFGTRYETYPHHRSYLPSKWPELSITYVWGNPRVLGSDCKLWPVKRSIDKK